jgi:hypothetical protein
MDEEDHMTMLVRVLAEYGMTGERNKAIVEEDYTYLQAGFFLFYPSLPPSLG